uniref:THAP domain containing 9 n=1 Tax=Nothobranchius pienaari TaxID=704102 RepID=A0A1A8MMA3_9TELE
MYIQKQTEFDGNQIHGYVDIGAGEIENVVATQALVIMVVAINQSWKLPIAYFLINSMNGKERASLIQESLSDHTQKIHVLLDPCHMLKLLRNVFATVQVIVREDGQLIRWQYIEELHKLQEREGLRLGNKLKMAHIQWQHQKMKVHLAAQIFSSSVAAALECCEQQLRCPQFSGCAATVDFLRTVDAAFDVLNAAIHLEKDTKHPSHQKLNPLVTLKETESLLRGLKIIGKDNRVVHVHSTQKRTPIFGFIACFKSVIGIYKDLVEHPAALRRYLLTYKLSQDHLELFFSAIRARGGHNNTPNVRQFRGAYKRLLVRHQVKKGTGNCLLRDNTAILDSTPATVNIARRLDVVPVEALVLDDDSISDLPDVNNLSEYKEAAISYITGFIVKKLKQKITCMPCSQALTSDESVHPLLALKDRERCFQRILKANEGKAPRGRGTTAAIVAQVVTDCSEKNLFPQLHNHMFDMCAESNHVHVLVKMASAWYCKIRLNHIARQETDRIKEGKTVRKKLTKLIHFYGD